MTRIVQTKANQLRTLARSLRHCAAHAELSGYAEKMMRAAREVEARLAELEASTASS
jgi:hypothetical protein